MKPALSSPAAMVLSESDWTSRREAHAARVRDWVEPRLRRRSRGESHPVEDFLFEYYGFSPGELARWHPGLGVTLLGETARSEFGGLRHYVTTDAGVSVTTAGLSESRSHGIRWMHTLLQQTSARPALFACAGLHEWAMVYRSPEVRHSNWPLRLGAAELAAFVESQSVCCTHFDAFRFFTPAARPLNRLALERATQPDFEQAGCLHANMDLYKWSMKLAPFVASELAADCFALAREIRVLDMRASPYDFNALGLAPVCIESSSGRAEYEAAQRAFAARAKPLREALLAASGQIAESLVTRLNT